MTKCLLRERNLTIKDKKFIDENYSQMEIDKICETLEVKKEKVKYYMRKNGYKAFVKRKLTEEQKKFIIKNYSTMTNSKICEEININKKDLQIFAQNKKLLKSKEGIEKFRDTKKSTLTKDQKDFIVKNYAIMRSNDICKKLNIEYKTLKAYVDSKKLIKGKAEIESLLEKETIKTFLGSQIEPKEDLSKYSFSKYEINIDYFKIIDTEYKAYWLGFLYADGYNGYSPNGKSSVLEIRLSSIDRSHLLKFLNSVQSTSPIREKENKLNGKIHSSSKISICNKNFCMHLNDKGCIKNKSLVLTFPTEDIVPKHLIRHFIRGYFDGDGCIYTNKEKNRYSVSFVGTESFLDLISKVFEEELGLRDTKKNKSSNAYDITWGGRINAMKIFNYLYKDCNIFLERKFNKFNSFICLG